jgi:preprotein translocase subunit SecA
MFSTLVKKVFGSRNERILRGLAKRVQAINALEPSLQRLSDGELQAKTAEFKQRYQAGESLDALLPEAFAVAREASVRTLGLRHFDVQLIGGMVLHQGKISEMRTGEGKTLVPTLTAYLNALSGGGVHIITTNEYLAKRDAAWMRPVYNFLGLKVGVIYPDMPLDEKQEAYRCDITYGTNNEFGFDYLRDNMAFDLEHKAQGELTFAIVDEVDSILIDEARTPLIISGSAEDSSALYLKINALVPRLIRQEAEGAEGDYLVDEKQKQVFLSELGHQRAEQLLQDAGVLASGESLYSATNIMLMHHLNAALRAHVIFHRDVDYIVQNNQVVIVDEHTGRTMPGRRWSDGLHQAVEAKEGVEIQNENQTLATITFQNFFRLYGKLAGMTGTADTEAYEFQQIYGLEVVVIPTHRPMIRKDNPDLVFLTQEEKFDAVIIDIQDCVARQQPVLVGTASIETSEYLAALLQKAKIKHQVLNAKFHESEAKIIAQAGRPGAVTIATNMAGRGTDIVLGGSLEAELHELGESATPEAIAKARAEWQQRHDAVIASGGLKIIGSERHESRRIDNQLRGRSGRQGDPGESRFYLSLQDNLMRIFASDRVASIMKRLGMQQGEAIEHSLVTRAIENAQRKVEGHNFDIRKHLLQFDDIANDQRKVIYAQRAEIMATSDIATTIAAVRADVIANLTERFIPLGSIEDQWDIAGLEQCVSADFHLQLPIQDWLNKDKTLHEESLRERIAEAAEQAYAQKETIVDAHILRNFEKSIMLQALDQHWREHLSAMEYLRQGIHLRGYAQKDPKQEFKRESFQLFSDMLDRLKYSVTSVLMSVEVQAPDDVEAIEQQRREEAAMKLQYQHASSVEEPAPETNAAENVVPFRTFGKVGRNDPCPCGSQKKYKHCHGTAE